MPIPRGIPSLVQGRIPGAGEPGGPGGPGGGAAPAPSAGLEVTIVAAPAYSKVLCQLPRYMSLQFSQVLNDKGAGTIVINFDDPWYQTTTLADGTAATTLFDDEHLVQVFWDGVLVFDFLMQTITEGLLDQSEQRTLTVTGPGTIAALAFAAAMPPGFPTIVFKTDAIEDGFAEIDISGKLALDTTLWNVVSPTADVTLNPSGTLQLTATPGTTLCGATPYDLTSSLISAQIVPVGQGAQATPDGSQVTQMYVQDNHNAGNYALIGVTSAGLYCQLGDVVGGLQTKSLGAYDPNNQLFWQLSHNNGQITFWTSADGVNWTQVWVVNPQWTPSNVTFFFAAAYDTAGAFVMQVTDVNGNVVTPSSAGNIFFGEPIMGIWVDIFDAAQARGTIPFIAPTFTAQADSFGNGWNDSNSVQIQNGTDLYSLLQSHTAIINADYLMQPGFKLQVGIPTTGLVTLGQDRSQQVIFREAGSQQQKQRTRDRSAIANLVGAVNSDGTTISASDSGSITEWGQREAWIETAVQVNAESIAIAAQASVEQTSDEVDTLTLSINPFWPGARPFRDFQVGDFVGLERPGVPGSTAGDLIDAIRIVAIAVSVDATGAITAELTVNTYLQWLQEQLQYLVNKLGGQFINSLGTTPVTSNASGPTQLPTIFAPNISSLGDTSTTGVTQGSPLVYNSVTGQWQPAGTADPNTGVLTPISMSTPGGTVTVAPTGGGATAPVVTVTDPSGTPRVAIGLQPDGSVTSQTMNTGPPLIPDTPTVVGGILGLLVQWDGKLNAGAAVPLSDFAWVQVHVSTITGFTPSVGTLKGTMPVGGLFTVGNLTAGTTYFVKLVGESLSGATSTPSTQASAIAQTVAANISPASITAGMVNFTAGQIGGISVSVSSVAPVSPSAGDLWFDGAVGYQLNQWSGSAWVPFQYGTDAIAAGTITAALIAANTITAAQIAAGTITATQIAAGTITATKLVSGLVVAGIVNGTLVTGAQIVATGTSGQFLVYSGTPASGNLIVSLSGVATTDSFGNTIKGGGLALYGTGTQSVFLGHSGSLGVLNFFSGSAIENQFAAIVTADNGTGAAEFIELALEGASISTTGLKDSMIMLLASSNQGGTTGAEGVFTYSNNAGAFSAILNIQSTGIAIFNTAAPPPLLGRTGIWSDSAGGNLSYQNGSDGSSYAMGRNTLILLADTNITRSAINLPGLSCTMIGGVTYRVHAWLEFVQGATAIAQSLGIATGTTTTPSRVRYMYIKDLSTGTAGTTPSFWSNKGGGGFFTSPAYAVGSTFYLEFDGVITPLTTVVFSFQGIDNSSAGTLMQCITGSFIDVMPVT